MAEEKVKLKITDDADTRVNTMEADVKVEVKYSDDEDFTVISDTVAEKGEVKSPDGEWEEVPEGKEVIERRVTITPINYDFYKSRVQVKQMERGPGEKIGEKGEKISLDFAQARTLKIRKEYGIENAISAKLAKLSEG
jgi:hypothetical protein